MGTQQASGRPRSRTRIGKASSGSALLLAVSVLAVGCAGSSARNPFDGDRGMRQIRIEVLNLNFSDATLWALRGGERHRLGIVSGKGEAEYFLDWPTSTQLRVEIDLLAAGGCVTRAMPVDPGDHIQLQIESDLSMDPSCERRR